MSAATPQEAAKALPRLSPEQVARVAALLASARGEVAS